MYSTASGGKPAPSCYHDSLPATDFKKYLGIRLVRRKAHTDEQIRQNVEAGSKLYTDEANHYDYLP